MSVEPENHTLAYLRRMDAKIDRILEHQLDVGRRVTALEIQVGQLASSQATQYANTMLRIDGIETRLDHIERRLELVSPA